ncbi:hypothetical protein Dsin_021652 [Dipteronia sinensis]|uniref:Endonuclease/exonuclease/phosphatase domain-containing protein n=1 Tax=Dipteronia sinensis TaxID=43782 RepID=A0AAE0E0F7_9ROSI|nr:hypothetical protein Dsin_021652 [Dipteronia sinensis]
MAWRMGVYLFMVSPSLVFQFDDAPAGPINATSLSLKSPKLPINEESDMAHLSSAIVGVSRNPKTIAVESQSSDYELLSTILDKKGITLCMELSREISQATVPAQEDEDELVSVSQDAFPGAWCMGGDFNAVLNPSERRSGECYMGSIRSFNEFVVKSKVIDIPMQSSLFTWSNNRERVSWARLDRFLLSPIILFCYLNLMQKCLPISISDHNAIVIVKPTVDWGPTPFQIYEEDLWVKEQKLRQKSIVRWLLNGDKNSRFLFTIFHSNRRTNHISEMVFEGVTCSGPHLIKSGILVFFKDHFKNVKWFRPRINSINFNRLSEGE